MSTLLPCISLAAAFDPPYVKARDNLKCYDDRKIPGVTLYLAPSNL